MSSSAASSEPAGVPWATVVSFAVVLAFADGYWVISLRGAVGAIERTGEPFATWVRESSVMTPLYVTAVLAGLILVRRRLGPVLRGARAVMFAALIVAVVASLVGVVHLLVSAAVDLRLQSGLIEHMGSMNRACGGECIARMQSDGFWLQARAIGYGAALLLLTNVLVVAWMVAMRGGRLRVISARRAHTPRVDDRRLGLAGSLAGAAVIHFAVAPEHLEEWTAAGVFFVVLAVVQLGVAVVALMRYPGKPVWLAAVGVAAGPLVVWAVSRTVGLPMGPEPGVPEALGITDLATAVLELAAVAFALALRANKSRSNDGVHDAAIEPAGHRAALVVAAVFALTLLGVAGQDVVLFGEGGAHEGGTSQGETGASVSAES